MPASAEPTSRRDWQEIFALLESGPFTASELTERLRANAGHLQSILNPPGIATSAVANSPDFENALASSRSPEIMADAAVEILTSPGAEVNGKCLIDSDVLRAAGVQDLSRYGGGDNPIIDIFVDR